MIPFHNEKLEFIGDAVLGLLVGNKIYALFPDKSEGELSRLRSALVNEHLLSIMSEKLALGEYLLLGMGELKEKGNEKKSILSDTFEALLGGVFIDHGFKGAEEFFDLCLTNFLLVYSL